MDSGRFHEISHLLGLSYYWITTDSTHLVLSQGVSSSPPRLASFGAMPLSLLLLPLLAAAERSDPSVANGELTPPDLPFPPMPSVAGYQYVLDTPNMGILKQLKWDIYYYYYLLLLLLIIIITTTIIGFYSFNDDVGWTEF